MKYTSGSIKINNILNRIDKDVNNNRNMAKNINTLESLLNQLYFKSRVKKILFKAYSHVGKIDKAYKVIKESYESTEDETVLVDLVRLLLEMGFVDEAKKYVTNAPFSNEKIYLLGVINEYEGNFEEAIIMLNKLNHTLMESNMHVELACIYEYMHNLEGAKSEFRKLLNTDKRYQAILRLIKIAFGENNPKVIDLIQSFDIDGCNHQGDIVQYKRCVKYYKYLQGKLKEEEIESYSDRQMYSYDKKRALNHIGKYHLVNGKYYKFNRNVNLVEIYDYCQKNLNHLIRKDDTNSYLVKMPYDIGYLMNYKTDLIEVVVLPNTNKILTMYPVAKIGMYEKMLESEKEKNKNG